MTDYGSTSEQNAYLAAQATNGLRVAVSREQLPRVDNWLDTIEEAYLAYLDREPYTLVILPGGIATDTGKQYDTALNVLDAFDQWLGRNIVFDALDWALDKKGSDL